MKNKSICPICGEPTSSIYGNTRKDKLCNKHARMEKAGLIKQCQKCGNWHNISTPCNCINYKNTAKNPDIIFLKELNCITCGEPSNGKHFCLNCYNKYKNKTIFIQIDNCTNFDKLKITHQGELICKDGHIVKSQAERDIDNFLFENGIIHGYETPLDVGTESPLKPDFYLKDYLSKGKDIYIEYFGLKGKPDYDRETEYKIKYYKKMNITVICMYPQTDLKNIEFALKQKLNKNRIKENKINYYEE